MNLHRLLKLSILEKESVLDNYEKKICDILLKSKECENIGDFIIYRVRIPITIDAYTINIENFRTLAFNTKTKSCILYYNKAIMERFDFDNSMNIPDIKLKWEKFIKNYLDYNLISIID